MMLSLQTNLIYLRNQAEAPKAEDEEESEKSMSEVHDEDEDEDGSGEVCFVHCPSNYVVDVENCY